jgi:hypothetical protein
MPMKTQQLLLALLLTGGLQAQTNPAISSWLINTDGTTGRHYVQGNPTPIVDADLANVQQVQYSANWVYVSATGVPSYITGPFMDGNPSLTTNQNAIFKISLNPTVNAGAGTATTGGNIGIFINGTAMFDYRDGVAWNTATNSLCGGPGNPPCPGGPGATMSWNRDAVVAEKAGFDCSKGHPAMGNYHHHQNPSAFNMDLTVISNVCTLYDAEGLYAIDSTVHSPLIGFSYDGYPVYGAYGYKNADGTGGITRIKSGYQLRNISTRTVWADGTDVPDGPAVSVTYPLGYFREDYEFVNHAGAADYLDVHNGRFCVTPEYPNGMYCYFATVDSDWNSAYPYLIGPTYYGVVTGAKVNSVTEATTIYNPVNNLPEQSISEVRIFPNPTNDLFIVQAIGLVETNMELTLIDIQGKVIDKQVILPGSTMAFFDVSTLYAGTYVISYTDAKGIQRKKIIVH